MHAALPGSDPAGCFDRIARCTSRATDMHAAVLRHFIGTAVALGAIYPAPNPAGPPLMLDPRLRPGTWSLGDPRVL